MNGPIDSSTGAHYTFSPYPNLRFVALCAEFGSSFGDRGKEVIASSRRMILHPVVRQKQHSGDPGYVTPDGASAVTTGP